MPFFCPVGACVEVTLLEAREDLLTLLKGESFTLKVSATISQKNAFILFFDTPESFKEIFFVKTGATGLSVFMEDTSACLHFWPKDGDFAAQIQVKVEDRGTLALEIAS